MIIFTIFVTSKLTCIDIISMDITIYNNPRRLLIKIIIIASHEDEMNDEYNDKLCTSNEVIQ